MHVPHPQLGRPARVDSSTVFFRLIRSRSPTIRSHRGHHGDRSVPRQESLPDTSSGPSLRHGCTAREDAATILLEDGMHDGAVGILYAGQMRSMRVFAQGPARQSYMPGVRAPFR